MSFETTLEAVDEDALPVVGQRVLMLGHTDRHADGHDVVPDDARAAALAKFFDLVSLGVEPACYEPRAAIYELRNLAGVPFWVGRNSSMGQRNNRRIIESFAATSPPVGVPISAEMGGFEERHSLLVELLGDANAVELAPQAEALAELIAALVIEPPEHATVEREAYVRTALIGEISGEWCTGFIVDPSPYSGPDEFAYLVVWTDSWTE